MAPDPRFPSQALRANATGEPRAERDVPRDRQVDAEPSRQGCACPFSSIADAHAVSPAAIDSLLEHLAIGVAMVDRDGRVVYANEAARALRIERLEPLQWAVTRALLIEDAVREDEIEVTTPGQPRRWLSAHVTPVRVAGVGVNAAFVTLTDVTAKARMRCWDPVIESLVNL
jgi:PAS domain-containing protein